MKRQSFALKALLGRPRRFCGGGVAEWRLGTASENFSKDFFKDFSFIFTLQEVEAGLVELVPVDDALRREWPELPSWRRVGQYANMEVQSRQILNNEHALQRAKQ